jgi:hypothetical protein
MIIGISGKKGHGKDSLATMLQFLIAEHNINTRGQELFKGGPESSTDPLFHFNIFSKWPDKEKNRYSGWTRKAFAGKLKEITAHLIGCSLEQLEDRDFKESPLPEEWNRMVPYPPPSRGFKVEPMTPRQLLQLLGTDCGRKIIHPNIWVNATFSDYRPLDPEKRASMGNLLDYSACTWPGWIITDVRFPNEAKAIKDKKGLLIRVSIDRELKVEDPHESETALDYYDGFDYHLIHGMSYEVGLKQARQFLINHKIIS